MSKPIYRAFLNDIVQCFFDEGPDVWLDGSSEGQQRAWAAVENAKAALDATPLPEPPTDEELLELMPETMRDEFSYAAKVCSDATGGQVKPGIFRVVLNATALDFARAVLERWGHR